ncbi:MAG: CrcB family protein [Zavarzinella sp.]
MVSTSASLLLIAFGGSLGALSRYAVIHGFRIWFPQVTFPWHTLLVNIVGSFLLGIIIVLAKGKPIHFFLGIGFCGSLTTFSTFAVEISERVLAHNYLSAGTYLCTSCLLCVAVAVAGMVFAQSLR